MECIPSFRDNLRSDIKPSFLSHAMTEEEFKAKKFGLPESKKFPMPDIAHVKSAIKFFNYVKPSQEQELANAILARIEEYGINPESINVGDGNRFKKYIEKTYLKHHGIKGMHWGIRRYQNKDGSLTPAGKKRYYSDDGQLTQEGRKHYYDYKFHGDLNREGHDFNERARADFNIYKDSILKDAKKSDPDFNKKLKRYKEIQKMNKESYKKSFDDFLKNKDYEGLDYEDFKDESYSRWRKTDIGKEEEQLEKDFRKTLEETVSKNPNSSKTFKQLRDFNPNVYNEIRNLPYEEVIGDFETIEYGKSVVNELMVNLRYD